jgi:predicted GH43/DUF377 family glycosyl hydrolase
MELTRNPSNPILEKNPAVRWEAGSVFNPTVWREADGRFGMLYRATNDVLTSEKGGYMSSVGLAWSNDGIAWKREPESLLKPDQEYESRLGCEDPRITKLGEEYFIFYTAVGGSKSHEDVRIALATTNDLKTVQKHGVVGPARYSKAAALFPRPIAGKYILIWSDQAQAKGGQSRIILTRFDSLDHIKAADAQFWKDYDLDSAQLTIPASGIFTEQEVGAVPIETEAGWLFIYSGFSTEPRWTICAALLDRNDPSRILAYSAEPVLLPESEHERIGVINNVCFPEGAVLVGDELYVYYGSGDQGICLATCKLDELLNSLNYR